MMKKRIVIGLLALMVSGCTQVPSEKERPESLENVASEPSEVQTRRDFILKTFEEYNYDAPDESLWEIKEEGPQKVVVIIKEKKSQSKPLITKLIFLENDTRDIIFLQINNDIIIQK